MRKGWRRALSLLAAAAMLLALSVGLAGAEKREYAPVRVYVDGLLTWRGYAREGQIFLPAEELCAYLGAAAETDYDPSTRGLSLEAPGLSFSAQTGLDYVTANGRYLYNPPGFLLLDGRVYLPLELSARIFGLTVFLFDGENRVELDLSEAAFLPGGPDYYEETYGSDDVLWLSRIISSESRNQPLAGMIGVGNVVLNRVASDKYPDTIFDVVFDTKNGIQFGPVVDGSIYEKSSNLSVIAACLCLEGYNTVGDSLFFVASAYTDDSWFRNNKVFVVSIGNHDFYM